MHFVLGHLTKTMEEIQNGYRTTITWIPCYLSIFPPCYNIFQTVYVITIPRGVSGSLKKRAEIVQKTQTNGLKTKEKEHLGYLN